MGTNLELLPLKHLQPGHGNLECLPVVILQQVLHPTADKIEALGPARLQRPVSKVMFGASDRTILHLCAVHRHPIVCSVPDSSCLSSLSTQVQVQWTLSTL